MKRKYLLGLPMAAIVALSGCAYDPVSKDNTGAYIPDEPVKIEPGIPHRSTNAEKRAAVPQDCKQQGLLGQLWRDGSTTLGLQADLAIGVGVAKIDPIASNCYDLVRIGSKTLEYPGINIRYVDADTLEVSVRMQEGQAKDYSFTADDSYGQIRTMENVSTDGNLLLRLELKSHALYAVEYDYNVPFGTEILVYLAH